MGNYIATSVSSGIPFDNSTNGYDSTDAQAAIEESKSVAISLPRFSLSSIHNGTVSNGQLIGVNNLVNVPIVVPVKSQLVEVTFYQNGGSTRDGEYLFYRNTQSAPNLFFTWTLNNTTSDVANGDGADFTSPTFNQGDTLLVYYNDTGTNHQDVSIFYFFQAVE